MHLVLTSNYFCRIQIYLSQSRCSLEPENFLSGLRPLNPNWGAQSTYRLPPAQLALYACFSADYVYSWNHVYLLFNLVLSWFFWYFSKKLYGPFYWMGFNCLRATEPLRGGSLLFTEIPGTHLIDLGRMKGWVNFGATLWFWTQDPWIGNPAP